MNREIEQKLAGEAEKGARANALLQSDVYCNAVSAVEQAILDAWKESPVRDVDGQHALRMMWKLFQDLQGHINDVATTGKMAGITLEQERNLIARAKAAAREFVR